MDDYYQNKIKYQIKELNKKFKDPSIPFDRFSEICAYEIGYYWKMGFENKATITYEFLEEANQEIPAIEEYIMLSSLVLKVIDDRPEARMIIVERVNL